MKKILVILLGFTVMLVGAERMVMGELFTSTTCPPCVSANATLTSLLSQKEDYLAVVRVHMYWPSPGNDPFYHYNKTENNARRSFYGTSNINAVPTLVIDGDIQSSDWGTVIDNRHNVESPLIMEVYRSFQTTALAKQGSGKGLAVVTNERDDTTFSFKLYGALTESEVAYTGTNGDPTHNQVLIKMLPPVTGTFGTDVTLGPSETKIVPFEFTIYDSVPLLNADLTPTGDYHIVNSDKCEMVFWSQIFTTKDVLQAAKVQVPNSKELTLTDISLVDNSGDGIFSPGEEAEIHLTVTNASSTKLNDIKVFVDVDNEDVSIVNGVASIGSLNAKATYKLEADELLIKAGDDYDGSSFNISCNAGSDDGSLGNSVKSLGAAEKTSVDYSFPIPSIAHRGSTVSFSGTAGLSGSVSIDMFDAAGRVVSNLYSGPASELSGILLPHHSSGLYFIRIKTDAGVKTSKIVILD